MKNIFEVVANMNLLVGKKNPRSYKRGLNFYRNNQWKEAKEQFEQAVSENGQHAQSYFKLGMCHFRLKNYENAVKMMSRAAELDSSRTEWQQQIKSARQKVKQSKQRSLPARNPEPKNVGTLNLLGLAQNMVMNAEYHDFESLVGKFSLYYPDNYCLGSKEGEWLFSEVNIIKQPVDLFQKSLAYSSIGNEQLYFMGKALAYNGRYAEAEQYLADCISEKDTIPEAYFLLATVLCRLNKNDEALKVLGYLASETRRAMLWKSISHVVAGHSLSSYDTFLLLKDWLSKSPNAIYHPDVTKYVSNVYMHLEHLSMAKKVWHDSIYHNFVVKKEYNRPSWPKYSQHPSAPLWLKGFSDINISVIEDITSRAREAIVAFSNALAALGVSSYPIYHTKKWFKTNLETKFQGSCIEVCLRSENFELLSFERYCANNKFILIENLMDQKIFDEISFQHVNGVVIRCLFVRGADNRVLDKGVYCLPTISEWENEKFCFHDVSYYLGETNSDSFGRLEDDAKLIEFLSSMKLLSEDVFICYLYEKLFQALTVMDQALEAECRFRLKELGEDKEEYQKVLSQNYMLATAQYLEEEGIEVILYVTGLENVAYQGNMWIPVLERLNKKCAIVIREKDVAKDFISTKIPVFYMKTMRDLELLDNGIVKIILYPANTQKNVQTLRFHKIRHYFINHGESDKVVNQSKFLMAYDHLLVAGPMAERRLKDSQLPLRDGQVIHVGRPQVELSLTRAVGSVSHVQRILYAPTWEGFVEEANYSSVNEKGLSMVQELSQYDNFEVYFKPHPYTGYNKNGCAGEYLERIRQVVDSAGNMHYVDPSDNIHKWMNESDILVTDISSVLNDYLYTLKPIILLGTGANLAENMVETYPSSKAAYILKDGSDIVECISDMLHDDYLYDMRIDVCRDSLGDFDGGSLRRFEEVLSF